MDSQVLHSPRSTPGNQVTGATSTWNRDIVHGINKDNEKDNKDIHYSYIDNDNEYDDGADIVMYYNVEDDTYYNYEHTIPHSVFNI